MSCRTEGLISLSPMRLGCDHHRIGKQRTKSYLEVEIKDSQFLSMCSARGWTPLHGLREETGVNSTAALRSFARWGESGWTQTEQIRGKKRWRAWSHPWAISTLSSFLLASFLWQSARTDHAGKATDVHLAPGAQKELKLLSHFFATCCKFKATRDKAFCMREWKEKRPLVILLADSQKHNSAGGKGEGNRSRRRGGSL